MSSSVVVITGANSGVGYAIVRSLLVSSTPYKIYCGARTLAKAQSAIDSLKADQGLVITAGTELVPLVIDVDSDESIAAAGKSLKGSEEKIDILINNAGIHQDSSKSLEHEVRKRWTAMFNTNVLGMHLLTAELAPLLIRGSSPRLIFISSVAGSLALTHDPALFINHEPAAGWPKEWAPIESPGYSVSKSATNMMVRQWVRWFAKDGVKVWALHPGFVATNIAGWGPEKMKEYGAVEPEVGGDFVRSVVEGERDGDAGYLIEKEGRIGW